MKVLPIKSFEAEPWIMRKHYARRMPSISYAFGLYDNENLIGICTYGMPASPFLCMGVCGKENKDIVIELNRLCIESENKNAASILVGRSLQMLPKPLVVVSYADTAQNHVGYVYQATNFLFTGTTKERTDMAGKDGKHSRHNNGDSTDRVDRSSKHRYVFFVGTKHQKKKLESQLMYSVLPYPKGVSQKYNADAKVSKQSLLF